MAHELIALWVMVVATAFILARNDMVFRVRSVLWEESPVLPSYFEMLYHPRHQLRWTVRAWRAYIDKS